MSERRFPPVRYQVLDLDGVRYAVLHENVLQQLCRRAAASAQPAASAPRADWAEDGLDGAKLARRIVARRQRCRLTQAELARRAGVRVETLNRLERGRVTPDFATIRKLVVAMQAAELAHRPESDD